MQRKHLFVTAIAAALTAVLVLAGCSSQAPAPVSTSGQSGGVSSSDGQRYRPVWANPVLEGEFLSLQQSEVEQGKMVHFQINLPSGKETFMAYKLDGVTHVRASICVPCRSTSFSLQKGVLICDSCGTKFEAKTGKGISGACVNYPKDAAAFKTAEGRLVVALADLEAAYASTREAG